MAGLAGKAVLASNAAWSPATLSPHTWIDFSTASSVTLNGPTVSQVNDLSGNGRHFTQATASYQPTYTSAAQNGLNVATFDGINDVLTAATAAHWNVLHDGTTHLVVVVLKFTGASGGFIGNANNNAVRGMYIYKASASVVEHAVGNGAGGSTFPVVNDTTSGIGTSASIVTLLADPDNGTAASRSSLFVNGGSAQANNIKTNAPSASDAASALSLGSNGSVFGAGWIGEVIIVTGANATEANRQALVTYANSKWAVY